MSRATRLSIALILNLALSGGLVLSGVAAHSTGLIADAGHNLTDAMAVLLVLGAALLARRPATPRRSWGLERATILAALANGIVLLAVTATIAWLAVGRLIHPAPVHGGIVLVAAGLAAVINLGVVGLLVEGHQDLSIRSALAHAVGDALSSLVVAASGLVALLASGPLVERLDPIASLVVAVLIVIEATRITRTSIHLLLEGVPPDVDLAELREAICEDPAVIEVHDLHVWALSSSSRALSAHVVIEGDPSVSEASSSVQAARRMLAERFAIDHATLEVECGSCSDEHPHA